MQPEIYSDWGSLSRSKRAWSFFFIFPDERENIDSLAQIQSYIYMLGYIRAVRDIKSFPYRCFSVYRSVPLDLLLFREINKQGEFLSRHYTALHRWSIESRRVSL